MKILHLITSIDFSAGGPSKSVSDLAMLQARLGMDVTVFTQKSENPYIRESNGLNLTLNFLEKSKFRSSLEHLLSHKKFDILHGHGLWQMPVHSMSTQAKQKNIPYIITPRGMLEPWALNAGKWKKKLALALFQKKDLAGAACIHATAQMEDENIRRLGFINPIAVIPNGIDIREFPLPGNKPPSRKNTLLFLSRIHPKKGIEILIEAWQQVDKNIRQNWQVEIAGNGEEAYIASLQKQIDDKGLDKDIKITGPQFGHAKLAAYHRASLFVLPTYSENFGIVVAEALACGVPVITTTGTPWEELNTRKAGWWIDIGAEPLAQALQTAMRLEDSERKEMGRNGRTLVEENYSIESVAAKMIQLYEWILKKREKPAFVDCI